MIQEVLPTFKISTLEQIRKRDGRVVPFDNNKIRFAVTKAVEAVQASDDLLIRELCNEVVTRVEQEAPVEPAVPTVELVQEVIERVLLESGHTRTAKAFILYRARRNRIREAKSELLDAVADILGNAGIERHHGPATPSAKMLQIGVTASREYYLKRLIPEEAADAHVRGDIHIHDLEHYAKTVGSYQIPLARLLEEGFATEFGTVRPARRPASAAGVAALALQQAQNDCFGGQSFSRFDSDFARALGRDVPETELFQAMEGFVYDLNTLHSRAGGQVPYSSVSLGLDTSETGRKVTRAVLQAFSRGLGRGEPAIFPNLTFKVKRGVNLDPGDPNRDLFDMALEVAAHRMLPNFAFLDAPPNAGTGEDTTYLSCCARILADRFGADLAGGRGVVATVSLNLPRIVLKARRSRLDFDRLLDTTLDLAKRQLLHRMRTLGQLRSRELPFLMGQGFHSGADGLGPDDAIAPALRHGTLSLGFVGLAEALVLLCGAHHGQSAEAQERGLALVGRLRAAVDRFAQEHEVNAGLYGSFADAMASRFCDMDRRDFGTIDRVTDLGYYSSSFHLPAAFETSSADLLRIEAPYHALCNAGHLTVAELSGPPEPRDLERLLKQMLAAGVAHGGIAFPLDHCPGCQLTGTFPDGCPECGTPAQLLVRVRRHSGYLNPLSRFSPAKLAELQDRALTLL
ncbi:MAG: anaerobic ribonucleoside-triphosphate reductase [Candidatus Sericytochromatia bacterium]|nr:anaerobic ribonucleoside-triphosphate reductase [Candidatus Tanganyikabacteria bacterium]